MKAQLQEEGRAQKKEDEEIEARKRSVNTRQRGSRRASSVLGAGEISRKAGRKKAGRRRKKKKLKPIG